MKKKRRTKGDASLLHELAKRAGEPPTSLLACSDPSVVAIVPCKQTYVLVLVKGNALEAANLIDACGVVVDTVLIKDRVNPVVMGWCTESALAVVKTLPCVVSVDVEEERFLVR